MDSTVLPQTRWCISNVTHCRPLWHEMSNAGSPNFVKTSRGVQVHIPPDTGREAIFHMLKKLNFGVREQTHFAEMKRANKSAVLLLHFALPLRNWFGAKVD